MTAAPDKTLVKALGALLGLGAIVAFVLVAAGVGPFGGPSGSSAPRPLSQASFVRSAERACLAFASRGHEIASGKKPEHLRALPGYATRVATMFDGLRTSLFVLVPPPADSATFRELLASLNAEDLAVHRWLHLIETRQWIGVLRASKEIRPLDERSASLWKKLGLGCDYVSSKSV
jgi:hypothetical protein